MAPGTGQRPGPRADVRLDDGPMQPVGCSACGAEVTVRKSSWDQTTIQWTAQALARCQEHAALRPITDRPNRHAFPGCSTLNDAVRQAAVLGLIEVHSREPLPTHEETPR